MKNLILVFIFFFFSGCGNTAVEKPEKLIDREIMGDILYDVILIQAAEVSNPGNFSTNEIKVNELIYKKYKIDSVTFAQSHRYYASDAHDYQKLFKEVSEKIKAKKEELDQSSTEKNGKPNVSSDTPAIQ